MSIRVGVIGTGMLGHAVAEHLIKSGYLLYVYNKTKNKTRKLEKMGATVCDVPKQVAENSDLVITVIRDAAAVKQVVFGANGAAHTKRKKLTIADMSTIDPTESKQISTKLHKLGFTMLDIPVMGGPNVAISGDLTMMASGDKHTFNRFKKVFKTIARDVFYLGEKNGTAHSIKLAMNLQISMLAISLSEGIILTKHAGIDPKVFLKILNSTYFKTGMSQNKAYKMIKDEFPPTFTLQNLNKDLWTIHQTSRKLGASLPLSSKALQLYKSAMRQGFGDLDYTGILRYIEQLSDYHK